MSILYIVFLTVITVVAYDLAASIASRSLSFPYAYASIGSALIYASAGFVSAQTGGLSSSIVVGVIAGLADSTIGWRVSWLLGPGRHPSGSLSLPQWFSAAVFTALLASVCAFIGGLVAGQFGFGSATVHF